MTPDMIAEPPRILVFTGDGKGKTTAAVGLALRAAGRARRVRLIQFVKSSPDTGELAALARFENVTASQCGRGFIPPADSPRRAEHRAAAEQGLAEAEAAVLSGAWDMVVLDELCVAVAKALVAEARVCELLRRVPAGMVVVLTGRGATPGLIELADTVTEMRCVKHAYEQGRKAQIGVEL